jgi:hypothetical protein
MKQFLKKIFLFLIPILLIFIGLEYSLRTIKSGFEKKRNDLISLSDSIEILILGNSHENNGINPLYFKKPAYNLAYGSQTILYEKQLILKYIGILKKLKLVIISLDYPSLYWGFSEKRDFFYYHYYDINIRNKSYLKEYISYFYYVYSPRTALRLLYNNSESNSEAKLVKGWLSYDTTDYSTLTYKEGKKKVFDFEVDINQSIISKENDYVRSELESLIIFLKQRQIIPILITTPCYKYFTDNLDKQILRNDSLYIEKLAAKYKLFYINSLKDTSYKIEHFHDNDHLNQYGAKKYTIFLDNIIDKSFKDYYNNPN